MTSVSEILRCFGPEYMERFGEDMPIKVMEAITACRNKDAGTVNCECERCGKPHIVYCTCGNRVFPTCRSHKSKQWLETQMGRQLPGHHTGFRRHKLHGPSRSPNLCAVSYAATREWPIRPFSKPHRRPCRSSPAMKGMWAGVTSQDSLGCSTRGGGPSSTNPHIHYIVCGGMLSTKDRTWHPSRSDFFVPVKALSIIFAAKFRDEIRACSILHEISAEVWETGWNVNGQAVGESSASLKYPAPYVFKVAISNGRIVRVEDQTVTFPYEKTRINWWRTMALDVMELIRRFLQHVLPTGLMKVRDFGFMNPNCKVDLDTIRGLIELSYGFTAAAPKIEIEACQPATCSQCGGHPQVACTCFAQ